METFRGRLIEEFRSRAARNPRYSLRAFAAHAGVYHGTLSALLSGKRRITQKAMRKIGARLGIDPVELESLARGSFGQENESRPYHLIHKDAFQAMSGWHFDAILEMCAIPRLKLTPLVVSRALGISAVEANEAISTLLRLELLEKDPSGRIRAIHGDTTNILDADFTNAAMRSLQEKILGKSLEALHGVDRARRDHTSLTVAIDPALMPQAKKLAQRFRRELNRLAQSRPAGEVYQLQISFFPLTNLKGAKK